MVIGILKGCFEETLEDSEQVVVVSGSDEPSSIASGERRYQMGHALTSEIHSPGRQFGADIAIIGLSDVSQLL